MRDRAQAKSTADNIGAQVGLTRLAEPLCTLEVQIAHSPKHPAGEHLHLAAAHHHAAAAGGASGFWGEPAAPGAGWRGCS